MHKILNIMKLKISASNKGIRDQYKIMVSSKCVKWLDFKNGWNLEIKEAKKTCLFDAV